MTLGKRQSAEWIGLGSALALMAALIFLFQYLEHSRLTSSEAARLRYSAGIVQANLQRLLEMYGPILDSVEHELQSAGTAAPHSPHISRNLAAIEKATLSAVGLAMANRNGIITAASDPALIGHPLFAHEEFAAARNLPAGRLIIQTPSPTLLPARNGNALILYRALASPTGDFGGLVMAMVDRTYLTHQLEMLHYAPEVRGALIRTDGTPLLVVPDDSAIAPHKRHVPGESFSRFMTSGESAAVLQGEPAFGSEMRLSAFRRLDLPAEHLSGALVVCVSRPLSAIFADWSRYTKLLALGWALIAAAASLWLLAYQRQRHAGEAAERQHAAERERAEAAVQESKIKLEAALDAMSDAVCISDIDGNFLHFNQAFATFHRFRTVEECALTLQDYPNFLDVYAADGEWLPLDRWPVPRALRGESGVAVEFELHRRDTGESWIGSYNYAPIRNGEGSILGSVVTGRDITEQRRIADALQVSEQFFRAVFEFSPVGTAIADPNGRFERCNGAYCALTGYSEEELKRLDFAQLIHPDDRDENLRQVGRVVAGDIPFLEIENRYVRKTGEAVWVRKIGAILPDGDGHAAHFIVFARNISERRQLEEALQISESFFRTLYEHAPIGIAVFHAEDGFERANPAFCSALGYSQGDLKGVPYLSLIHSDDRQTDLEQIKQLARGEREAVEAEIRCVHKEGYPVWARVVTSVLPQDDRIDSPRYLLMLINIDRRKAAEQLAAEQTERLAASEDKFRATFEQAPIGIAHVAMDGRFLRANRALCDMLGRTAEEIVGVNFREVTYPPDLMKDMPYVAKLDAGEIPTYSTEKRYVRKDGSTVWSHLTLSVRRKADGEGDYRIAIIEDIEERKRAEADLNRSRTQLRALTARLQEVREEERTSLARTVHDELGQLVTGITLDVAGLRRLLTKEKMSQPALLEQKFTDIAELTSALVGRIREISSDLRPGILDAIGLPAALRYEATRFAKRAEISCVTDITDAMPPIELGCSTMLFRVFQELLTNIGRHAEASEIRVSLDALDHVLVLEVCDNGRGITEAELANNHSLGLLGIRERVARWGGEVEFFGKPGEGTAAIVTVPLDEPTGD